MQAIFATCAMVIFVAGFVVIRDALKTGKFLDRSDDPEIADTWVLRSENPRGFWLLLIPLVLTFGWLVVEFSCLAIFGASCLGDPGSD